jgi:hypothetical protein
MKKFLLIITSLAVFSLAVFSNGKAQDDAFKQGNVAIGLGLGFGVYITEFHSTYKGAYHHYITEGAVCMMYPLTAEYGVTDWLGLGGRFAYSDFLTQRDSQTGFKRSIRIIDADMMVNFHLIKTDKFDMPIVVTAGFSNYRLAENDALHNVRKDNGINYGLSLNPRIYFNDYVGMYFVFGYGGFNYSNLTYSNDRAKNINPVGTKITLRGDGTNLGMGLTVKF